MKRGLRALALAAAAALALAATPALADESPTYLALGDSVPFGYSPLVTNLSDADAYVGYPEDLAGVLDTGVRNASCPGETSGSLISTSAPDNGCQTARSLGDLPERPCSSEPSAGRPRAGGRPGRGVEDYPRSRHRRCPTRR